MTAVQPPAPGRYKTVSDDKATGATYTPPRLADFVADRLCREYKPSQRSALLRVLDPAVGDGALLLALLGRLRQQGFNRIEVHGFDVDQGALDIATREIGARFPGCVLHFRHENFLDHVLRSYGLHDAGGLFEAPNVEPCYDLLIANPPYVRTQVMGAELAKTLANQFGLTGRVDLYHAFLVAIAHVLKPGGLAGIIVSNRFMTTKAGVGVRECIRANFAVHCAWDLGDTKLFDAAVLPAVLVVERSVAQAASAAQFTSIYETDEPASRQATDVIDALDHEGVVAVLDGRKFHVRRGALDPSAAASDVWRVASVAVDDWLATVESRTWRRFGDVGKIRVGVKTCADKVFIRTDWAQLAESRPELLRPLTTHHVARQFKAAAPKKVREILYPHASVNGSRVAVDLANFPRSAAYLEANRAALEGRTYVIEGGRQWFEIWVPQDPASWSKAKLVFRDIAEQPTFWIDLQGTIVNGDCYWMAFDGGSENDLLWLAAAVANSTFIETFYDHCFNNKLYAGRRRFITQYVERFPLPDPELQTSREIVSMARTLYSSIDSEDVSAMARALDIAVWAAFGVSAKEIGR